MPRQKDVQLAHMQALESELVVIVARANRGLQALRRMIRDHQLARTAHPASDQSLEDAAAVVQVARPQRKGQNGRRRSQTSKSADKAAPAGISPTGAMILQKAFGDGTIPLSRDELCAKVWGKDWRTESVTKFNGNDREQIRLPDDLTRPNSIVMAHLRQGLTYLRHLRDNSSVASTKPKNLGERVYHDVVVGPGRQWSEIVEFAQAMGVPDLDDIK